METDVIPVSVKKTLFLGEPLPYNPAAETALQALIWCSEKNKSNVHSSPEECLFHRHQYVRDRHHLTVCHIMHACTSPATTVGQRISLAMTPSTAAVLVNGPTMAYYARLRHHTPSRQKAGPARRAASAPCE